VKEYLDDLKRAFTQLQFGLWHHFGILTYTGTWAQGNLPINDFNPGNTLNPQQWAQAAKSAGAKFGVLTTLHHDGFALWPRKASNFNVWHITWMNGKGDVVKQFVDGYRAEGLLPAFYVSPLRSPDRESRQFRHQCRRNRARGRRSASVGARPADHGGLGSLICQCRLPLLSLRFARAGRALG
jgi:alpha-L-fucosidase